MSRPNDDEAQRDGAFEKPHPLKEVARGLHSADSEDEVETEGLWATIDPSLPQ